MKTKIKMFRNLPKLSSARDDTWEKSVKDRLFLLQENVKFFGFPAA